MAIIDENNLGNVKFYDITTKNSPQHLGNFFNMTIDLTVTQDDKYMFIIDTYEYGSSLQVVDFSTKNQPIVI